MELTNYSFLQSRNDYMSTIAERKVTADRIATGKRLENAGEDVGAIHQAAYQETELRVDRQSIVNLMNLRSFLFAQENSLKRVHEMYDKMEILAIKSANPMTSQTDRADYEIEFSAYREQLDEIMNSRYNGKLLFSSTEMCGGPVDITLKELDMRDGARKGTGGKAARAQTVDTGSPSGTLKFRVNSGGAGDTYRVWMGDVCVFRMGPEFNGPDHTKQYNENGPVQVNYNDNFGVPVTVNTEAHDFDFSAEPGVPNQGGNNVGWRTSGSAQNGDDDLVEISFGPGEQTTYSITPGGSNDGDGDGISDLNSYDPATRRYDVITTTDLPDTFDRTEMTLQVETRTIGVIYQEGDSSGNGETETDIPNSKVEFTPLKFIRYIPKDRHGNVIELNPKGFDRFEDNSLLTHSSAKEAADKMRGNNGYFGEMKCIVENRIGSLGAEYKRVDSEIRALENQVTNGEMALGRIQDADMAREATELARNNLKSELATQVMANSSRLKDVLIPLTTDHFRGAALSASL